MGRVKCKNCGWTGEEQKLDFNEHDNPWYCPICGCCDLFYGVKMVKELKNGEWFTLKPIEYPTEKQVYIRGDYDRSEKKYWVEKFWDVGNGRFLSGNKEVYTDFIF